MTGLFEDSKVRRVVNRKIVFLIKNRYVKNSGLRGNSRPYLTILKSADHAALFKMVRYVLLLPLRPELFTCQSIAVAFFGGN
jgi:hypothetical protein